MCKKYLHGWLNSRILKAKHTIQTSEIFLISYLHRFNHWHTKRPKTGQFYYFWSRCMRWDIASCFYCFLFIKRLSFLVISELLWIFFAAPIFKSDQTEAYYLGLIVLLCGDKFRVIWRLFTKVHAQNFGQLKIWLTWRHVENIWYSRGKGEADQGEGD